MKSYLNETFRPFSIPYDARFVGELEIGSNIKPGMGLTVTVWEGETTGEFKEFLVMIESLTEFQVSLTHGIRANLFVMV